MQSQSLQNIMSHVVKTTVNILSKAQLLLVMISYNVFLRTYTMHALGTNSCSLKILCVYYHTAGTS